MSELFRESFRGYEKKIKLQMQLKNNNPKMGTHLTDAVHGIYFGLLAGFFIVFDVAHPLKAERESTHHPLRVGTVCVTALWLRQQM